jgi:hypothetical protein
MSFVGQLPCRLWPRNLKRLERDGPVRCIEATPSGKPNTQVLFIRDTEAL